MRHAAHSVTRAGDALAALAARPWPGNVRELRNAVERLRVLSDEEPIGAAEVERVLGEAGARTGGAGGNGEGKGGGAKETLVAPRFLKLGLQPAKELFEREYLVHKLRECGYNVSRTAEAIGVYPSGLHAKLKKLGIEPEK